MSVALTETKTINTINTIKKINTLTTTFPSGNTSQSHVQERFTCACMLCAKGSNKAKWSPSVRGGTRASSCSPPLPPWGPRGSAFTSALLRVIYGASVRGRAVRDTSPEEGHIPALPIRTRLGPWPFSWTLHQCEEKSRQTGGCRRQARELTHTHTHMHVWEKQSVCDPG